MSDRVRVAVVDDHPLFRAGVAHILNSSSEIELVGEGSDGGDALRIAQEQLPDVLLLDISLPGDGIATARSLVELCPFVRVIMLTASESEEDVTAALEAGARGYVLKGVAGPDLVRTVLAVANGETYVTPALAARLLTQMRYKPAETAEDALPALTPREEEILDGVAEGHTNKEIARNLNISEKTVKHYMTNIMHKLQVRNRVEAALIARKRSSS